MSPLVHISKTIRAVLRTAKDLEFSVMISTEARRTSCLCLNELSRHGRNPLGVNDIFVITTQEVRATDDILPAAV